MIEPKRPKPNRLREHRIEQEIVVDAYNEEERALGWYCYLNEKLAFPYKSPLPWWERVGVRGINR
jgi:hypothetical protein